MLLGYNHFCFSPPFTRFNDVGRTETWTHIGNHGEMHLLIAWMFGNYAQIACAHLTLSIKLALCYVNAILFITRLNTTWIPLHMLFGMDIAGANQTARPIATPSFRYTPQC